MGRYKSNIQIPADKLEQWGKLRSESDAGIIAEQADVVKETVYLAFKTGKCSPQLFDLMCAYYENKLNELYEMMNND